MKNLEMEMTEQKPLLGSRDPRLPAPLSNITLKVWAERHGLIPGVKPMLYMATFDEILQPTPDVRLFRMTLDGYSRIMPFLAGQFIQLLCPVPDKADPHKTRKLVRSYSIASAPEETRFLEFCIKLVPDGDFTPTLWDKRVGDKIELRGPYGKFVVPEPVDSDIVFIAAGTGIAPFWGMVQHLLKGAQVKQDIVLFFGVRYEEDLLYVDEFKKLAAEHPNFKPVFTLSRSRHPETWRGETGYVQSLLSKHVRRPADTKVFICGLTPMIEQSVVELGKLGVPKDRIHYERYD
jgi:ferredoxin-NADP reductase